MGDFLTLLNVAPFIFEQTSICITLSNICNADPDF